MVGCGGEAAGEAEEVRLGSGVILKASKRKLGQQWSLDGCEGGRV